MGSSSTLPSADHQSTQINIFLEYSSSPSAVSLSANSVPVHILVSFKSVTFSFTPSPSLTRVKKWCQHICGKGVVGASSVNLVQKNNSHKNKKKPLLNQPKAKQTTTYKNKKKGACYVCASTEHFAAKCPNRKGKDSANMVISEPGGTSGYGNSLPTVLSVFCSP